MECPQCAFDSPPGMKFCGQCGSRLVVRCPACGAEPPPGFKFCGECGAPLYAAAAAPAPAPAAAPAPAPPPAPAVPPPAAAWTPAPAPPPAAAPAPAAPVALPAPPSEPPRERPAVAAPVQSYTPSHLADQVLQYRSAMEGERKQVTVLFCDLVNSTPLAERLGPEIMHQVLNRFFEMALSEIHRFEGTINQFLGDGFMALFGAPIAHEDHARRAVLAALGFQKLVREHHAELALEHGVEIKVRMGINTGWVVVGGIGDHLRKDYTAVGDTTNLAARLQQMAEPGTILASEATGRLLHGSIQLEELPPLTVKGKAEPVRAFKVLGVGARQSDEAVLSSAVLSPFVGRQREMATLDELRQRAAGGEGQVVGIAAEAGSGKSRLLYELRRKVWNEPVVFLAGRCLSYGSGTPYLPLLYMLRQDWGLGEADPPAVVADRARAGLARAGMNAEEALPYMLRLLGVEEGTERLAELSPQALQTRTFALLRQWILNSGQGALVVLEIEDLHWVDETSEEFLSFLVEGLPVSRLLLVLTYRSGYRPRWIDKSYATQISLSRLTARESQVVLESVLRRVKLADELVHTVLSKAEGNPFFVEELARSLLERPDVSVPDTIQGVLLARIDRLPEEHKRLLQTASVLGREFPLALLTAIWEGPGSLAPLLADLKRWEFLYEEPTAEEPLYFFKHALTQEGVYLTLLTGRRQSLHAAAGQAFETLHAGRLEDVVDRLAYHYSAAGNPPKAVSYLMLSAEKAARGYAHAEAAKALREALAHCLRLAEGERDRRTLEVVLQLAASLLPLAQLPETLELLLSHHEAAERLGDPAIAGRYWFWLAHTYSYLGNQEEAAASAGRAIEEARRCGDQGTEGKAWYVLSRDAFWAGRFSEGIGAGLEAVALLEKSGERWWQGQAYWVAGFHHYVLGRFEEALAAMARAHAIWEALADPRLDPSWSTGYFYATIGDYDAGIAECRGGLERAQDPLNTAAALGFLGYAYLEKGEPEKAAEALEDSVKRTEQAGMRQLLGWFSAFLAEAELRLGRPVQAAERARRAVEVTREVRFWYGVGLALRAEGRIARETGDLAAAEERLQEALASFRALEAPFETGRTLLDLARVAHARGEAGEAAQRLGQAYRTFAALGVSRYVERAERLARELAVLLPRDGGLAALAG